jgi:glycosyltransferase involved in cell wall biosynthesis
MQDYNSSVIFSKDVSWPRITIVTAVYNGADYLDATIRSILRQGYPNLEYIIIDDGSTDNTSEIIKKYEKNLTFWTSHSNRGLYRSLNVGFERATGEIMGWLNASDMLHINSLFIVGSVFKTFADVKWITGRPSEFSPEGMPVGVSSFVPRWSRLCFLMGDNRAIQQESTFWRRSLWQTAGNRMEVAYRAEGDFELWIRFFRHAQLYPVDALLGGYRRHEGSLSSSDINRYHRNCDVIVEKELALMPMGRWIKSFRRFSEFVKPIPFIGSLWYWLTVKLLYPVASRGRPPVIRYDAGTWKTREL